MREGRGCTYLVADLLQFDACIPADGHRLVDLLAINGQLGQLVEISFRETEGWRRAGLETGGTTEERNSGETDGKHVKDKMVSNIIWSSKGQWTVRDVKTYKPANNVGVNKSSLR